jgi:hypothetical protein
MGVRDCTPKGNGSNDNGSTKMAGSLSVPQKAVCECIHESKLMIFMIFASGLWQPGDDRVLL